MKLTRKIMEESETIQMAPLIDIVFLTLVFFMTTAVYTSLESEIDVTLPTAGSAEHIQRAQGEIFINLLADGRIIVSDREYTIEELQGVLNKVSRWFPGGSVIIRGDRDAILGKAISILDCCKNADIQNVSFAALTEEPKEAS
jgi:biopolymer transport protein ExbD